MGALFAVQALGNFGPISVSKEVLDEYIWGKIAPGVGVTLFAGNVYYSWQAIHLTNLHGRQYTAQPYGLNTPAAFSFLFNIIYVVFFQEGGGDAGFIKGYKVALAANFITGLISVVLGCFGTLVLKAVPPAALLVPIAGIGFTFLGIEQVSYSIAAPIVGYSTIMWVYLGWYSGVRVGWGNYRCPEALQVILIGVILGWATSLNKSADVVGASKLVKWWGPVWTAGEMFDDFGLIVDYLGIVIPIGISAAATTLMCLGKSANFIHRSSYRSYLFSFLFCSWSQYLQKKQGKPREFCLACIPFKTLTIFLAFAPDRSDPFPICKSMIVDGIGTCIASFFGSPFGAVIYIGHPAHKASGAKVGYSFVNGIIYL